MKILSAAQLGNDLPTASSLLKHHELFDMEVNSHRDIVKQVFITTSRAVITSRVVVMTSRVVVMTSRDFVMTSRVAMTLRFFAL